MSNRTFDDFPKTTRVDEIDATTTYIGLATAGTAESMAQWRIMKVIDGSPLQILYPKIDAPNSGSSDPIFVWADRASYSYS